MSNRRRRLGQVGADAGGQAAVEFALASPVLLILLVTIIQLGWALHCASSVRWALEASARALMIKPTLTDSEIKSAMVSKLSGLADTDDLTVTLSPNAADKTLVLKSVYKAKLAIPLFSKDELTFNNSLTVPNPG